MTDKTHPQKRLGTVRQYVEAYPFETVGGVRNRLFTNFEGFRSECSIKVGAKVIIDFDAADAWLEAHRESA